MIKILCLVGESGSGKSTIAELLSKEDRYNYVQSYTTRAARAANEKGHIFADSLVYKKHKELDVDETSELKIIAETFFDGNYYWTVNTQFLKDKINIYVVDPKGVSNLKKISEFDILTIYLNSNASARFNRIVRRDVDFWNEEKEDTVSSKTYKKVLKRMDNDREVFKVIKTDYVINSDRVPDETLKDVKEVMEEWKC